MSRKIPLVILPVERLVTLPTKRLISVLRAARAVESSIYRKGHWSNFCCELCYQEAYGDSDPATEAKPYTEYIRKIKTILSGREHVAR